MTSSTIQKKAFFVYKASAGAGKTYNLALRYISICLDQFENNRFAFEKILAITFTNKAVGEMKERILKFLEILSSPSGTDSDSAKMELIGNLQLEKQLTDNEIGTRAQNILKNILENYSRFSIMTIDKFYQLILNNYAFELQIPSNYRLELDEKVFMQQMVDLLLAQLGEDDRQ
ncbi:MAG: UvrD-helicase domain-containing protein, partial [Bacteroidales bacterium]|nr:UvrD-helicase domain-containing protein [Bacteroidales bacterium]